VEVGSGGVDGGGTTGWTGAEDEEFGVSGNGRDGGHFREVKWSV